VADVGQPDADVCVSIIINAPNPILNAPHRPKVFATTSLLLSMGATELHICHQYPCVVLPLHHLCLLVCHTAIASSYQRDAIITMPHQLCCGWSVACKHWISLLAWCFGGYQAEVPRPCTVGVWRRIGMVQHQRHNSNGNNVFPV
jgi:hypothetical protein